MAYRSIFFYDNAATEGTGGATDTTANSEQNNDANQTASTENAATETAAQFELPEKVKNELAELRAFRDANKKPDEKSPEQLSKEKEQDRAEFIKYAVDNDLCNIDDITKYESLKVQSDADLVFPQFLQDFKEDNPEIEDENELAKAAKSEFESRFKINSPDEKIKAKGLSKLAKEANDIRSPYETKVKSAEVNYTKEKDINSKLPDFDKFVSSQIEKFAPNKISFKVKSGDQEIPVEIELSKADKAAIEKDFKSHKVFYQYNKNGVEETSKSLERKINGWIRTNKFDLALEKAAAAFEEIGKSKGSNIGAENAFGVHEQARQQAVVVDIKSNQEANNARKSVVNR